MCACNPSIGEETTRSLGLAGQPSPVNKHQKVRDSISKSKVDGIWEITSKLSSGLHIYTPASTHTKNKKKIKVNYKKKMWCVQLIIFFIGYCEDQCSLSVWQAIGSLGRGTSGQPVGNCLDDFNQYGQNYLNCGWIHSLARDPGLYKLERRLWAQACIRYSAPDRGCHVTSCLKCLPSEPLHPDILLCPWTLNPQDVLAGIFCHIERNINQDSYFVSLVWLETDSQFISQASLELTM